MDNHKIILGICVVALCFSSLFFLKPQIAGDSISYLESMQALKSNTFPPDFSPNRIITTFGGLSLVIILGKILGSIEGAWLLMNAVLYVIFVFAFYKILEILFESKKAALIGALFLAGNYALLRFGLNFLMDLGGWTFYTLSLLFVLKKNLRLAALMVGIGGLFKEYAFLGIIPIAVFIIYENRYSAKDIIKKAFLPGLLALTPIAFVYLFAYFKFHYTYLDWFSTNKMTYIYPSRIIEYIKSLGSLLNLLGFLFLGGVLTLFKDWSNIPEKIKLFLVSILISILPIFFWPAITQRILFITIPFVIIVSGFFIKKYESKFLWFLPLLFIYVFMSFFMDSFILKAVNLPI